jgi:hypothetical protein
VFLPAPSAEIAVPQDDKLSPAPHGVQGSAPRPPSPLTTYKLCSELSRRDTSLASKSSVYFFHSKIQSFSSKNTGNTPFIS